MNDAVNDPDDDTEQSDGDSNLTEEELRKRWPSANAAARVNPDGSVVGFDDSDDDENNE